MKFKLKIQPEEFSTPDRKQFSVTEIEAYPVGTGVTTAEGIEQLLFYFSFLGENGKVFASANANVETILTLPDETQYPLLSNLFSITPEVKYEAMSIIASGYNYTALPFEQQ